ncbi:hypothetical protein CEXT_457971 [Caerostris extrusa]|uniref:Uncharacterized protein n=1 Tax=Caerostris extrusa TaxID=172846 RepID=A0AAV4TGG0_CAEEX|nr:hypothetical protein CEXT_457971 [Caerostris extrusa]
MVIYALWMPLKVASSPRRSIICKLRSNFNCLRSSSDSSSSGFAMYTQETYSSFRDIIKNFQKQAHNTVFSPEAKT